MNAIMDSIAAVLESTNINLSTDQLDVLQDILVQEKKVYNAFDKAITTQQFTPGWRDQVTSIAVNVLKIIRDARAGVQAFKAGKNPSQEAILDSTSIDNLVKVVTNTQQVYAKLDAYTNSILAGHDAKDTVRSSRMAKKLRKQAVLVFGS